MVAGKLAGIMRIPIHRPPSHWARRQRGAALAESAAALGVVLLMGLAAMEAMHWQLMRQLAYVALSEAARAGATGHAHPSVIAQAFEAALVPRYASPGGAGDAMQTLRAALARTAARAGMAPWRIVVARPGAQAYADFAQRGLKLPGAAAALPAIRNEYQAEQHAGNIARGLPDGKGPRSGLTIFQANTLQLRLRYLLEPLSAPARLLLQALAGSTGPDGGLCARRAWAAGVLPLRIELTMDMQSHPVLWPDGLHSQVGTTDDGC